MESTATVDTPKISATVAPTPVRSHEPVAPVTPAIQAPPSRGPREMRDEWESLQNQLTRDGEMALDMSGITELNRAAVAQIIRFLQAAEARNTRIMMINVPAKTHAMLEILGVHHLVAITSRNESQR